MPHTIDLDKEMREVIIRNGMTPKPCEYLDKRCSGRVSYVNYCLTCKNGNGMEFGFKEGVGNTICRCATAKKMDMEV